jgi:hypothetical protein
LNSRERLTAAARGGETDRIPWFAWAPGTLADTAIEFCDRWQPDAVVVQSASEVAAVVEAASDVAILVEVGNPFGAALLDDIDLNDEFEKGPQAGGQAFENYVDETESALAAALESGADGVLYRLFGAEPLLSTPMQFGGFYLEQERELLAGIRDARFNVLYVEGGEGLYLDVVSDLEAHAVGWDEDRSAIPATEVREMRRGALACGLLNEDPLRLFRNIGGSGLILSGKVEDLAAFDFQDIVSASQTLAEVMR